MDEDLNGLISDIFSDTAYQLPQSTVKKQFKPWHKPRKQYVRLNQWCNFIRSTLPQLKLDGRPLRYLGLPGSELLDIRLIHDTICVPNNVNIRFLGFNTALASDHAEQQEYAVSLSEVINLPFVDRKSRVLPDDFSLLSNKESVAVNAAKDIGPFDIVNIDLCNALGKEEPGAAPDNCYEAILKLIHLQASNGAPWLLFLTTRVGNEYIHELTVSRLKACIDRNFENPDFCALAEELLDLTQKNWVEKVATEEGFYNFYATAISKWLIGLGLSSHPMWRVELADILSYKVHKPKLCNDMLSAVFVFNPIQVAPYDKFQLSTNEQIKNIPKEHELALAILNLVAKTLNLDDFLDNNKSVAEQMVESSATLMKQARYDEYEYLTWGLNQLKG